MNIKKFISPLMSENCYLVSNEETKECFVIDAGDCFKIINDYVTQNKLKMTACVFTHGHFDHILCAHMFNETAVPIYISERDKYMLSHKDNLARYAGEKYIKATADQTFSDGDILSLAGMEWQVIATPGHTAGSCCFLNGKTLFTGDTLLYESFGRTDFPTGNNEEIKKSIEKILMLSDDTVCLCGHGQPTTIAHERELNPYRYA